MLALKLHPDKNRVDPPALAAEKFQELGRVFDVLGDPKKRAQYNKYGDNYLREIGHLSGGGD